MHIFVVFLQKKDIDIFSFVKERKNDKNVKFCRY